MVVVVECSDHCAAEEKPLLESERGLERENDNTTSTASYCVVSCLHTCVRVLGGVSGYFLFTICIFPHFSSFFSFPISQRSRKLKKKVEKSICVLVLLLLRTEIYTNTSS